MMFLGVDPGRCKFGWALVSEKGDLLLGGITPTGTLESWEERLRDARWDALAPWMTEGSVGLGAKKPEHILLGNGTAREPFLALFQSRQWIVTLVDERHSTLEARKLFRCLHPLRGWRRWLPEALTCPERDLDDLAAWCLVLRFLGCPSPLLESPRDV